MLNGIWGFMILGGILFGILNGKADAVTGAVIQSAGDTVSLCITMAGAVALWMGLMEIARQSGLVERMTKGLAPFLHFLFPKIPKGHPALEHISTNLIANLLGLGWACTPAGLKAMEALAGLERERGNRQYFDRQESPPDAEDVKCERKNGKRLKRGEETGDVAVVRTASKEMCTFLILNISSLQLIPINMIAYRCECNSSDPAAILAPAVAATLFSTLVAVLFCKMMDWSCKK